MSIDDARTLGTVGRTLPGPIQDGNETRVRLSRYGEQHTVAHYGSKLHALADEGTYFTATNATLGTAITGTAAPTAFSATVGLLSLYNGSTTKSIYLDYLLLSPKAAGTNGTNFLYAMSGDRINRYTSGGTAITPVNTNMSSDATSAAVINVGALTIAAASSARRLSHGILRTVIKVIGDKYLFKFGDAAPGVLSGIPLEGTTQANINEPCPPIVIGPGHSFVFHEIAASQSVAATYEFSLGYWER